jgi:hypothetical protein
MEPSSKKRKDEKVSMNIQRLPLNKLRVDHRYQRLYKKGRAENIGRSWDDKLAGVITVSKRSDGGFYIIDGQHRVRGAEIKGKEYLDADVREGLTLAEEAQLFDRLNADRALVSALERFRARLLYGDPVAIEIRDIVYEFDGTIAEKLGRKNKDDMGIRSIGALERVYTSGGPEMLRDILGIIKQSWDSIDYETTNEYTLGGLRWLIQKHNDNITVNRLVERLNQEGYGQIRRMAHASMQIFGGSGPVNFYRAMVEAYNKGLTVRNRLKP